VDPRVTIFVYRKHNIHYGAKLALQHRLHRQRGALKSRYRCIVAIANCDYDIRELRKLGFKTDKHPFRHVDNLCCIVYVAGIPIASCLVYGNKIMLYVKRDHRRKGIGTLMYNTCMKTMKRQNKLLAYVDKSNTRFFNSVYRQVK
jgi:GNAT superfamily N-acetyltransferase